VGTDLLQDRGVAEPAHTPSGGGDADVPHSNVTERTGVPHDDAPEPSSLAWRGVQLEALRDRYRGSTRAEKGRILDEFVSQTGYHRKHAVRLLRQGVRRARQAFYDEAVTAALVAVWEAAGRVGSRRLTALLPGLVASLTQQGRLPNNPLLRGKLLSVSEATIDRILAPVRGRTTVELCEERLRSISRGLAAIAELGRSAALCPDDRLRLQAELREVAEATSHDLRGPRGVPDAPGDD